MAVINRCGSAVWVLLLLAVAGYAQQTQPGGPMERQRERILQRFDRDGDGRLSPEEREAAREFLRQRAGGGRRQGTAPQTQPDLAVPKGVKAIRNIEYAHIGGKRLLLDLYLPKDNDKPLPVVVWIHGGGWRAGDKERCPALPLAGKGFAVASINYRLTDVACFPAQIHDCKGAIRWLRAHAKEYKLDPERIGVWGSSAGGHLVALLGTSGGVKELEGDVGGNTGFSSRVQAVCDLCGPATFREEDLPEGADEGNVPQALTKLLGGPLEENRDKARAASPVTHITKDDPPFLIVHGDADPVVPVRQSRILAEALKKAGVDVTLRIIPGAGHGVNSLETQEAAAEFFRKHLNAGKAGT